MLKLFNSLTNKKEKFKPITKEKVGLYSCGPTVYDCAHIGNLRSYIFTDILQRALKFNHYRVSWIMNITDVDDKTIRGSKIHYPNLNPKEALKKFTSKYEKLFWRDLEKLNIQKPNKTPRAIEFIPQMQKLIIKILAAGYAYEKDGSFYFNVKKYSQKFKYGQLIKLDLKKLKTGARALSDEYEKEELQDFVLWKTAKANEPSWNFKYGGKNYPGRPGWHIECSAMSKEYLSIPFDIHTGGVDLKFPHHENEIAQGVIGCRTKKLANFFLHNEHVLVDGQKMSKGLKNFYTLNNLAGENPNPLAYRYFCLNAHYRSKLNFTWQGLGAAQNALENLYQEYIKILPRLPVPDAAGYGGQATPPFPPKACSQGASASGGDPPRAEKKEGVPRSTAGLGGTFQKYRQQFLAVINDDLNTPQALAIMWSAIKDEKLSDTDKKNLLLDFDKVLGLGLSQIKPIKTPAKIQQLAAKREKLRQEKKWQEADKIRKEIENAGYQIEDTDQGPKIKNI